jgi:hypothetical protein
LPDSIGILPVNIGRKRFSLPWMPTMTDSITSRELVAHTLRGEPVPRVPRQLWTLPWAEQHHADALAAIRHDFPDDIANAPVRRPPVPGVRGAWHSEGLYVDEWGCTFTNIHPGIIGEVKKPLIRSYASDLDRLRPPDGWIGATDGVDEACAASDRFLLGIPGVNPFERMQWIRGTENLLCDLVEQPAGFFRLRKRVHEWSLAMIDTFCATDVDAVGWADDWGSQRALLIRPELWRDLFKPLYREYVDRIHAAGKFAFMHSDGYILDIYEDLIEIGVDAINSQLFCMDIEAIGHRFRNRITFWGEIDRQHILTRATPDEVRRAVRRVAGALHDGNGRVIAQCEFGPGGQPANIRAVFDEWNEVGQRRD